MAEKCREMTNFAHQNFVTEMIIFFKNPSGTIVATETASKLQAEDVKKLSWLYGEADALDQESLEGFFVGPRREMITPWSTNAVEITQNMGLKGISRIEEYFPVANADADYDPMLQRLYKGLDQSSLSCLSMTWTHTTSRRAWHYPRRRLITCTR